MIEISEVTDATALEALGDEWRALVARTEDASPFQTWEWCSTWWRHHGRGRLWVLRARAAGETVGLMPLTITRWRGTPFRQVRFMGAPLSDYQGLIGPVAHAGECAAAFFMHLHQNRRRWELCDFADQREGSALTVAEPGGLNLMRLHHRVCPVVPLAATWDAFAAGLSRNMRSNLGRRRRQIGKAFRAEYDLAGAATVEAAMEELFRLHNARWRRRGAMGAFAGARMQAFHHEVARRFLERGWLKLHRVRLDGETRAAFYCFQYGGRVYYYLSGFDLELSKYSLGNVAMAQAIADAIQSGASEFDLLRGDESYKFQWRAVERNTLRLVIGHGALRSRLALGAHRFERFVEREGLKVQRRLWGRRREKAPGEAATTSDKGE
jgi:CelD/BcsL family acetyltransferase involved in cellulose biosynthesis